MMSWAECAIVFEDHPLYGRRVVTVTGLGKLLVPEQDTWISPDDTLKVDCYGATDYTLIVQHAKKDGGHEGCSFHDLRPVNKAEGRPDFVSQRTLLQKILKAEAADGRVEITNPAPNRMLLNIVASLDITPEEYKIIEGLT